MRGSWQSFSCCAASCGQDTRALCSLGNPDTQKGCLLTPGCLPCCPGSGFRGHASQLLGHRYPNHPFTRAFWVINIVLWAAPWQFISVPLCPPPQPFFLFHFALYCLLCELFQKLETPAPAYNLLKTDLLSLFLALGGFWGLFIRKSSLLSDSAPFAG